MTDALLELLREHLGVAQHAYLMISAVVDHPADMAALAERGASRLSCSSTVGELIYRRDLVNDQLCWMHVQSTVRAETLHELPTAELRAQARALLALPTESTDEGEEKR